VLIEWTGLEHPCASWTPGHSSPPIPLTEKNGLLGEMRTYNRTMVGLPTNSSTVLSAQVGLFRHWIAWVISTFMTSKLGRGASAIRNEGGGGSFNTICGINPGTGVGFAVGMTTGVTVGEETVKGVDVGRVGLGGNGVKVVVAVRVDVVVAVRTGGLVGYMTTAVGLFEGGLPPQSGRPGNPQVGGVSVHCAPVNGSTHPVCATTVWAAPNWNNRAAARIIKMNRTTIKLDFED